MKKDIKSEIQTLWLLQNVNKSLFLNFTIFDFTSAW